MRVTEDVASIEKFVVLITCNKCCRVYKTYNNNNQEHINTPIFEGLHANLRFGYDSRVFGDMSQVQFDLCEQCLETLVDSFLIPATTQEDL